MTAIEILLSSPLPTAISVIIAVACLLGFYFFVVPMIAEVKALREENQLLKDEAQTLEDASLKKLLDQNIKFNRLLGKLEEEIKLNPDRAVERVISALGKLNKLMDRRDVASSSSLIEIRGILQGIVDHSHSSKSRDDNIFNLMQEVIRHLHSISDKQSQIIGALLGMSKIQNRNRNL